uniref:Uncharacterized protein n=1 Tax=Arundo donax TaxID=35708 RepID=A0A0A8YCI7_ARUDO
MMKETRFSESFSCNLNLS